MDWILRDPILGNPIIWALLIAAVIYFFVEFFEFRLDEDWEKQKEERLRRYLDGDKLEPVRPHVTASGRVEADPASLLMAVQDFHARYNFRELYNGPGMEQTCSRPDQGRSEPGGRPTQ